MPNGKAKVIELTPDLAPEDQEELDALLRQCKDEIASCDDYRAEIGDKLITAKELAGHGNWAAALERIGIPARTASEYMAFARDPEKMKERRERDAAARKAKSAPSADLLQGSCSEPVPVPPLEPAEQAQRAVKFVESLMCDVIAIQSELRQKAPGIPVTFPPFTLKLMAEARDAIADLEEANTLEPAHEGTVQ